ncbi:hypothetical protein B296_00006458 [Ensete ventricosum]|uniref:Uncharacterized protein n=1 Tax=Ensete ventricosum TaxID=4639 RepID=A0A426ZJ10_ENSVE|nr:hypothetical protein B296_00006458 [Ensete ventricosum]
MARPQTESPAAPNRETPPDVEAPQPRLDFDTLSTDTADSLREQVRRVHQRLDEVQKEVVKSREEVGESSKSGSPFTLEIQAKPLPTTFRLPALEPYDGSGDPTEHIATFRAQMALYDSSEALMWDPRPPSIPGHPSILDGAEVVKILLVADRATTHDSARDATTGTPVYGGRDANSRQAG